MKHFLNRESCWFHFVYTSQMAFTWSGYFVHPYFMDLIVTISDEKQMTNFIQYMTQNWSRFSLCGLHELIHQVSLYSIRISLSSLYGIRIPLFSLYGIAAHTLTYVKAIVLDMTLLWVILSQGPLLWRHNDMAVIVSWNTRSPDGIIDTAITGC